MNKKRFWVILTMVVSFAVVFSACTPAPTPAPAPAEVVDEPIKVALILSGPISDASWNAAAYNAIMSLKDKYNIELQYTENVGLPDIEPNYRDYASKGFDVIIGHGFQFGEPAVKVAPDFPDTKWGIIMGINDAANVESLNFREEETSYLAGYLAGLLSETGVVGGVGGEEIPSIIKSMEAFKLGAQAVNPDIKVLITYTGTWIDPTAGLEAGNAQISNGADVLFPAANLTSTGVYQAAKEKGVMAIGSEGDQCAVAPGVIKASIMDNIDKVLELMLEDIKNGTFKGATNFYGIKEGAISMVFCSGELTPEVEAKVKEVEKQIVDGTFTVPVILEPTQ